MKEQLITIATILKEEQAIELLEEAITSWRAAKLINSPDVDEKKQLLVMHCNVTILNHMTNGSLSKATEVIEEMDKFSKAKEFFETPKN